MATVHSFNDDVASASAAILRLLPSLQNARKPTCCPTCLCDLANTIDDNPIITVLRQEFHAFWDACMAIVAVPRPAGELDELRPLVRSNMANCSANARHPHIRTIFTDPLAVFIHSVFRCVYSSCAEGEDAIVRRAGAWKRVFTDKHRWPTTPQQLFPFGEKRTVEALVDWSCMFVSWSPILLLMCFLALARLQMMPHICSPPVRDRFIWLVVRMLRQNLRTPLADWPGASEPCALPDKWEMQAEWLADGDRQLVQFASGLLGIFTSTSDMRPEDLDKIMSGYEPLLHSAVQSGFDVAVRNDGPEFEPLHMWMAVLHHRLRLPDTSLDRRIKIEHSGKIDTGFHWTTTIYSFLHGRSNQRECHDAHCARFENDGRSEGRFQVCARCKIPRYCSRECQKRDWREGIAIPFPWRKGHTIAHKVICPILCKIFEHARLDMEAMEFGDAWEAMCPRLATDEVTTLVEWIVSCRVLPREVAIQFMQLEMMLPIMQMSSSDYNELVEWLGLA